MQVDSKFEVAFGRLGDGASARAALDLVGEELEARQRDLDLQIYRLFEAKEAPGAELLLSVFAQKHAAWKMLQSLQRRVEASKSAARTLQPMMEKQSEWQPFV